MKPLNNLKILKLDMEKHGWVISSFLFVYKNINYIVLVKLYLKDDNKPNYALLKLHFIKEVDFNDDLEVPANTCYLMTNPKTLREYFGIEYSDNLGDILNQFSEHLGKYIPTKVKQKITDKEKQAMVRSLSNSDAEAPNKIYCYKVLRNRNKSDGTPGQRSPFNDNKTRILRPELYEKLHSDNTLSFCYSTNPLDLKNDETIILNWTKRHSN